MKPQLLRLCGLATLAAVGVAADKTCVDCEAVLVSNSNWANGVLAQGDYYNPSKTGNWLLGRTTGGTGDLELRNDPSFGNYVWNLCPKGHSGYCRVYMAQVVTVQAGVTYDFSFQYAMDNVRGQADTLEVTVTDLASRNRLWGDYTYAGNTAGWVIFGTPSSWTAAESGDVLLTITWRNDPNDATVRIRGAALSAVECRNPVSTKTCSAEPELPSATATSTAEAEPTVTATSTTEPEPTVTATSTTEPEPTITATSTAEPEPTITATSTAEPEPTATETATSTALPPKKGCSKRRRRRHHN
ncbi:hypothetical protein C8A05DRAFT_29948 [Staphylotrichum tortipilum]|uniref:CBM-cenC domain-containing protein n=1 Tax=Staphylotrichum tortipilum TaxID=2831512 RepID=A0AAN6MTM8_9PEZI|nr:hypothetical protein C8A05DRAFT_29948 [Staphylotrichum longicolle]